MLFMSQLVPWFISWLCITTYFIVHFFQYFVFNIVVFAAEISIIAIGFSKKSQVSKTIRQVKKSTFTRGYRSFDLSFSLDFSPVICCMCYRPISCFIIFKSSNHSTLPIQTIFVEIQLYMIFLGFLFSTLYLRVLYSIPNGQLLLLGTGDCS